MENDHLLQIYNCIHSYTVIIVNPRGWIKVSTGINRTSKSICRVASCNTAKVGGLKSSPLAAVLEANKQEYNNDNQTLLELALWQSFPICEHRTKKVLERKTTSLL